MICYISTNNNVKLSCNLTYSLLFNSLICTSKYVTSTTSTKIYPGNFWHKCVKYFWNGMRVSFHKLRFLYAEKLLTHIFWYYLTFWIILEKNNFITNSRKWYFCYNCWRIIIWFIFWNYNKSLKKIFYNQFRNSFWSRQNIKDVICIISETSHPKLFVVNFKLV